MHKNTTKNENDFGTHAQIKLICIFFIFDRTWIKTSLVLKLFFLFVDDQKCSLTFNQQQRIRLVSWSNLVICSHWVTLEQHSNFFEITKKMLLKKTETISEWETTVRLKLDVIWWPCRVSAMQAPGPRENAQATDVLCSWELRNH
jgi:hypothetical protein